MKKKLVVLTGAGISAESGLGTFRDSDGLWEKHKIEDVATPEAWLKNKDLVQEFYNQRRRGCLQAKPNKAHLDLVTLENLFDVQIVTQNIDDLHERAGSQNILHLHGEILKSKCSVCNDEIYYDVKNDLTEENCCPKGHQLRPHVVWFGEAVPMMDQAIEIVGDADHLLIIGTSLNVYPAANLIHYTSKNCKISIIDPNVINANVDKKINHIRSNATEGVQKYIEMV